MHLLVYKKMPAISLRNAHVADSSPPAERAAYAGEREPGCNKSIVDKIVKDRHDATHGLTGRFFAGEVGQ
jgi:hypothetical protein